MRLVGCQCDVTQSIGGGGGFFIMSHQATEKGTNRIKKNDRRNGSNCFYGDEDTLGDLWRTSHQSIHAKFISNQPAHLVSFLHLLSSAFLVIPAIKGCHAERQSLKLSIQNEISAVFISAGEITEQISLAGTGHDFYHRSRKTSFHFFLLSASARSVQLQHCNSQNAKISVFRASYISSPALIPPKPPKWNECIQNKRTHKTEK